MSESFESNLIKIPAKEVVDELYGAPPTKGDKDIAEFRKKKIQKPEKNKLRISALSREGKEVIFDFEKIKENWVEFYRNHSLEEIAQNLDDIKIQLTEEQVSLIQEKSSEGFNHFILFPSLELQLEYLNKIENVTTNVLPELKDMEQYFQIEGVNEGFRMSEHVKEGEIQYLGNIRNGPYLLLTKDIAEVEKSTLRKEADRLVEKFKNRKETGLTYLEYFIFQRDYVLRHLQEKFPHPDTKNGTWLLNSAKESFGVPGTIGAFIGVTYEYIYNFDIDPAGQLYFFSEIENQEKNMGARSAIIFELIQ